MTFKEKYAPQTQRVLDRLLEGPVTNVDLCRLALSYTRRIKDLREDGHTILCNQTPSGLNTYELVIPPVEVAV